MTEEKDKKQENEANPSSEPVTENTAINEESFTEKHKESFGDKATQFADKSAEVAEKIFENLKKGFSQAFDSGSKWAGELNKLSQEYAEKYNNYMEVSKLTKRKNRLTTEIGKIAYNLYKTDKKIPEEFLKQEKVIDLLEQINHLDNEIIQVGKKLDSEE